MMARPVLGERLRASRKDDDGAPGCAGFAPTDADAEKAPRASADAFAAAWARLYPDGDGGDAGGAYSAGGLYRESERAMRARPTVHVRLAGGKTVSIVPEAYFELQAPGVYRPRIYLTEGTGGVLGGPFLRGHDVLFDNENLRLGVARAACLPSDVDDLSPAPTPPAPTPPAPGSRHAPGQGD